MRFTYPYLIASLLLAASSAVASPPSKTTFPRKLHAFMGNIRGNYILPGKEIAQQIMMGLAVHEGEGSMAQLALPPHYHIVAGCRLHSCDEKSAVLLGPNDEVVAAALINFHCGQKGCQDTPVATLFLRRDEDNYKTYLTAWAASKGCRDVEDRRI